MTWMSQALSNDYCNTTENAENSDNTSVTAAHIESKTM